jgi:hypothetical protein
VVIGTNCIGNEYKRTKFLHIGIQTFQNWCPLAVHNMSYWYKPSLFWNYQIKFLESPISGGAESQKIGKSNYTIGFVSKKHQEPQQDIEIRLISSMSYEGGEL